MTYSVEPVSAPLIDDLFARLWPRGIVELERLGVDRKRAPNDCLEWSKHGNSGVFCADGRPVVVYGICPDGENWASWFQATDEFDLHHRAITPVIAKALLDAPENLHVYSVMVHPKTERWFNKCGLVKDDWNGKTVTGWPLFRFSKG